MSIFRFSNSFYRSCRRLTALNFVSKLVFVTMDDAITAEFPIGKLKAAFFGNVLIFTVIGWIPVMLLVLFLQFHFLGPLNGFPAPWGTIIFIAASVPGFLFALWFARKQINKGRWQLTDSELLCGIYGQQKFPLASVEKIIVGLPPTNAIVKGLQKAKPGTALGATVDVLSAVDSRWKTAKALADASTGKENSMLICFTDGSWLPLRLYLLPNGRELMAALKEQCRNRVIESYEFSPEELRRLRRRDVNELIPPPA